MHLSESSESAIVGLLPAPILARFTLRRVPRGRLISTPLDPQDCILLLRKGRIRVYVASDDKELTLTYLVPGELFSTHTRAYLCAETSCDLLSMPTREFVHQAAGEPGVLPRVMPVLGRILDNSIAIIEDLAFRDVAGRLARFLLAMARQQVSPLSRGVHVSMELSVREIALMLGTSRQTISSLLSGWARDGLIERPRRGRLQLLDLEALQAHCNGTATKG